MGEMAQGPDAGQPRLKVEYVATGELVPYEGNAKEHPDWHVDEIAESIKELGFDAPVVAWHDADGRAVVVAGHGRLRAAEQLGMARVPVVFVDHLDDAGRRALTLADNQLAMVTGWDEDKLQAELDALADEYDMSKFGFDLDEAEEEAEHEVPGEVPFAESIGESRQYVVIRIDTDTDWAQAQTLFGLRKKRRWYTNKDGSSKGGAEGGDPRVCRVVTWEEFCERFGA